MLINSDIFIFLSLTIQLISVRYFSRFTYVCLFVSQLNVEFLIQNLDCCQPPLFQLYADRALKRKKQSSGTGSDLFLFLEIMCVQQCCSHFRYQFFKVGFILHQGQGRSVEVQIDFITPSSSFPFFITWPKTLFLDRYYFHRRHCVCVSVSVYLNYLKKILTDFIQSISQTISHRF